MNDSAAAGKEETSPSPAQSATAKLDTLSRDDLIKFVKKQAVTIKTLKNKVVSSEQPGFKSSLDAAEEYSVLKSERDVLYQKYKALSSEKERLEEMQSLAKLKESKERDSSELAQGEDDTLTRKTKKEEESMIELQKQIKGLQGELSRSESECASLRSRTSDELAGKLEASEQKLKLLDLELSDYQRNSKQLDVENSRLKEKLRANEDVLREGISEKELVLEQVRKAESESSNLTKERDDLLKQIRQQTSSADEMRAELEREKRAREEAKTEAEQVRCEWEEHKLYSQELEVRVHETQAVSQRKGEQLLDEMDKLQRKNSELEKKLSESTAALDSSVSEYENYKIRVHGVLKQKSELVSSTQQLQQEVASLETRNSELLSDSQRRDDEISKLSAEVARLREELGSVEERRVRSEQASLSRVESLHTSKNEQIGRQVDEIHRLHEQVESLKQTEQQMEQSYDKQIQGLQRAHQEKMTALQQENLRLQDILRADEAAELPPCGSQQRTQGEGMEREYFPLPSKQDSLPSSPPGSSRGFYLERLLSSGPEHHTPTPEQSSERADSLAHEVAASQRQLRHLSELLRESESGGMLLEQQAKLLKEEIRRLERNSKRGEHLESLEYLKNVVVQFLTTSSCRHEMLPVLQTLLQLCPEEVDSIQTEIATADQLKKNVANSASFAWSSYDPTNINIV